MSNTSNASKNVRRFLLLFALGIAYGFMYVMPYMKSSFYDQMIAAMGCTNAQLGSLMTAYCICCTVSYLPGGWIGDKFNPKPVLLISIFGQAALSFLFMFTYKSYAMAVIIWLLMGLTGGFAFWPAIMKGIRLTGTDEEQGRIYGIFEALNGFASLLLSFIMIGVMAVVGGSDLITGFKSALAFMGGLSLVSGVLVAILMPKDAAYGVSEEEKQKKITFKDYMSAFKIPGVWIMAVLVWCYVTISAVASYLTPYSTGVLGMSAALAASVGTFRTYGCRLIGGPLGGYLAESDAAGPFLMSTENGRQIFVTGHPEYDKYTLDAEYKRDVAKDLPIHVPVNYYPDDDPAKPPLFRWRAHAHLLYENWLNYYVYQNTPYDLGDIQRVKHEET